MHIFLFKRKNLNAKYNYIPSKVENKLMMNINIYFFLLLINK